MSNNTIEDSKNFDINDFNKHFDDKLKQRKMKQLENIKQINEKNAIHNNILFYQEPFGTMMINTKDSFYETMDDIIKYGINHHVLTKNNRMFYIGVIIIFVISIIFIFDTILHNKDTDSDSTEAKVDVLSGLEKLYKIFVELTQWLYVTVKNFMTKKNKLKDSNILQPDPDHPLSELLFKEQNVTPTVPTVPTVQPVQPVPTVQPVQPVPTDPTISTKL